jgi:regulatory protein
MSKTIYYEYDEYFDRYTEYEVDDEEYLKVLRPLLKQKNKSIKAENDYERNQKLVRFALGRGYTFDIIKQCLDVDDIDEEDYD